MWGGPGPAFPFGGPYDDDFGRQPPPANPGTFTRQFRCYPVSFIDRADLEHGNKIVLPPSALDTLSRYNIAFPMLFKITSRSGMTTHCGVQEFIAEEGHANLPYWIMQNLGVAEGDMISISNASLLKGNYVKFQPQTIDFLQIANPKAVLEATLRKFACLTAGDTIAIDYNDKIYYIDVLQVAPGDAISIIETDVNTEFEAPPGYVEPQPEPKPQSKPAQKMVIGPGSEDPADRLKERLERLRKREPVNDDTDSSDEDKPPVMPSFPGSGQTLKASSGRGLLVGSSSSSKDESQVSADIPQDEQKGFVAFGGKGRSLR